jgi:hypothetical protein
MTPEEIRAIKPLQTVELAGGSSLSFDGKFTVLREIAAQLAEQNAIARESLDMRKADDANMKAFREQSLRTAGEMRDVIAAPPQLVPVFRVPPPSEQPEHLGCFVLLPDGTYAMAVNGERPGMVPLELEEAQRLIAVMSKPPEGKPS